jgi:hypothetical protein
MRLVGFGAVLALAPWALQHHGIQHNGIQHNNTQHNGATSEVRNAIGAKTHWCESI